MKKRLMSFLLVLVMIFTLMPTFAIEAAAISVNDSAVFLKQSESGKCTLASAAMMLRRRAIIDGNANWSSITESSIKETAWVSGTGLRWDFTYSGMRVIRADKFSSDKGYSFPGMSTANKKAFLIQLLKEHPEGIEIYDLNLPHAVLLTDYDSASDTFYCADPANSSSSGRIKLTASWNGTNRGSQDNIIANIGGYWYIANKSGEGPGLPSVTFDANGGTCATKTSYCNTNGTLKTVPTAARLGYDFAGWFTAKDGGTKITASTVFTKDTTVYAHWTKLYKVTFDANGGTCDVKTDYANKDGKLTSLPKAKLEGRGFVGWFDSPEGGSRITADTVFTKDTTVYAHWRLLPVVTFDANGGSCSVSTAYVREDNNTLTSLPTAQKENHSFLGWYTSGGTKVSTKTQFTANTTVYAKWKPYPVVTFVAEGGTCETDSMYVNSDGKLPSLPTANCEGHAISFWADESGTPITIDTVFTKDTTVYAQWNHVYADKSAAVTPTCTTPGYTEYSCSCGRSIRQDYIGAYGHSYVGGVCERCGKAQPKGEPFSDVNRSGSHKYYYDAIIWAVDTGVTNGTSQGKFSPDKSCTRAQVVTFLWRAAGCPQPETNSCAFTDVKQGEYYYKAMLWAVENKITSGMSESSFGPNLTCTRAQIVTFLYRFEGNPIVIASTNPFKDVKTGDYFYAPVMWASENGVTTGVGNGRFAPNTACTRAQVVTFIYRALVQN